MMIGQNGRSTGQERTVSFPERIHWAALVPVESPVQRAILTILAEAADGVSLQCYPSKKTIAERVACSRTTLYRHIERLKEQGLLTHHAWRGASTLWTLPAARMRAFLDAAKAEKERARTETSAEQDPFERSHSAPERSHSGTQTGLRTGKKQVFKKEDFLSSSETDKKGRAAWSAGDRRRGQGGPQPISRLLPTALRTAPPKHSSPRPHPTAPVEDASPPARRKGQVAGLVTTLEEGLKEGPRTFGIILAHLRDKIESGDPVARAALLQFAETVKPPVATLPKGSAPREAVAGRVPQAHVAAHPGRGLVTIQAGEQEAADA